MIHVGMFLFMMVLFVLLTPGLLLRIPKHGSLLTSALVHGAVFATLYHLLHKFVWHLSSGL
jgi:hypothetical protein